MYKLPNIYGITSHASFLSSIAFLFFTAYSGSSPCFSIDANSIINHVISYTDLIETSELSRIFDTLDERFNLLRKRTKQSADHFQAENKSHRRGGKGRTEGEEEELRHSNSNRFHCTRVESHRMLKNYDEVIYFNSCFRYYYVSSGRNMGNFLSIHIPGIIQSLSHLFFLQLSQLSAQTWRELASDLHEDDRSVLHSQGRRLWSKKIIIVSTLLDPVRHL